MKNEKIIVLDSSDVIPGSMKSLSELSFTDIKTFERSHILFNEADVVVYIHDDGTSKVLKNRFGRHDTRTNIHEYDVKYQVNQPVYILNDTCIYKRHVQSIKIIEDQPHIAVNAIEGNAVKGRWASPGIFYLIPVEEPGTFMTNYKWHEQKDVYDNPEELIRQITIK